MRKVGDSIYFSSPYDYKHYFGVIVDINTDDLSVIKYTVRFRRVQETEQGITMYFDYCIIHENDILGGED